MLKFNVTDSPMLSKDTTVKRAVEKTKRQIEGGSTTLTTTTASPKNSNSAMVSTHMHTVLLIPPIHIIILVLTT